MTPFGRRFLIWTWLLLWVVFFGLGISESVQAAGTAYQRCKLNMSCVVGEYLYDDSYVPITSATCTLSSRNPDGTIYQSAVSMPISPQNDGWYSVSFDTTGKTEGLYRAQMCCTSGAEYMCLDKSYEIGASFASSSDITSAVWSATASGFQSPGSFGANLQTAAPTATEIWNSPSRTLTGFGSLINDMWNYSARSLTTFGTLVSDVWSSATRTLTGGTLADGSRIATLNDVQVGTASATQAIKGASNKDLSQVSDSLAGVQSTTNSTEGKVDLVATVVNSMNTLLGTVNTLLGTVNTNVNTANSSLSTIDTNLNTANTNINAANGKLDTLSGDIAGSDSKVDSVLSAISTVSGKVDTVGSNVNAANSSLSTITTNLNTANSNISTINTNVNTANSSLSTINTNVNTANTNITSVNTNVGTANGKLDTLATNLSTVGTNVVNGNGMLTVLGATTDVVNGKVDALGTSLSAVDGKLTAMDLKLDTLTSGVATLVTKWGTYSASDLNANITSLQTNIGTNADDCSDSTVFGYVKCNTGKWGTTTAEQLLSATNAAATSAASLREELNYNGKSTTAYQDLQTLLSNLSTVSGNVGTLQTQVTAVDTKLTTLTNNLTALTTTVNGMNTNVSTILTRWSTYSMTDVMNNLSTIQTRMGTGADSCSTSTVFGYLNCVNQNGGGDNSAVLNAANIAASQSAALRAELDFNGKSTTAYTELQSLRSSLNTLSTEIGTNADGPTATTMFGNLKKLQTTVEALDTTSADLSGLLDKWGSYSAGDIYNRVSRLSAEISAINTVPNVSSLLTLSQANDVNMETLKNKVLELKALTQVNKALLQEGNEKPIVKLWLEEGSIIFKTLLTNPSNTIHSVPLNFYLPREAKEKDILKIDEDLVVKYDPTQDAVSVTGNIVLGPNQSKVVAIEVEDIWKISDAEIESVRMQADELAKPLQNTSFFAQGATLKADINAALDTAKRVQADAKTPEARIRAYREAVVEMKRANDNLGSMKTLVSSAGSAGSLAGFVGGVQTIAVWGLILVLTTGFVFLGIYMRMLTRQVHKHAVHIEKEKAEKDVGEVLEKIVHPWHAHTEVKDTKHNRKKYSKKIGFAVVILLPLLGILTYWLAHSTLIPSVGRFFPPLSGEPASGALSISPTPSPTSPTEIAAKETQKKVQAQSQYGDTVVLRAGPGKEFDSVGAMNQAVLYPVLDFLTDKSQTTWLQVQMDAKRKAWVSSRFVAEVDAAAEVQNEEVMVRESEQVLGASTVQKRYVVRVSSVNLRQEATSSAKLIRKLPQGTVVEVQKEQGPWVKVQVESVSVDSQQAVGGWLRLEYLKAE